LIIAVDVERASLLDVLESYEGAQANEDSR